MPPLLPHTPRLLKDKLEAMGVSTFVSSVDIGQGEEWRRTIARSLDECKQVTLSGGLGMMCISCAR